MDKILVGVRRILGYLHTMLTVIDDLQSPDAPHGHKERMQPEPVLYRGPSVVLGAGLGREREEVGV